MAEQYCRWNPELKVCSMRISWVKEQSEYPLDETLEVWRKEIFGCVPFAPPAPTLSTPGPQT